MGVKVFEHNVRIDSAKDMNVLYLSYMGLSEPLLHSQTIPYLEALSHLGFKITILSFEKKEAFQNKGESLSRLRLRLRVSGIQWHFLRYHKRPPLLSTFFDLARGTFVACVLTIHEKIHLIHARGTVMAAVGFLLKKLLRVQLLFDVRGLMAEEYVDGGLWERGGWVHRIASFLERRFLMQSDALVFLSHRIVSTLKKREPALFTDHRTVGMIPCCVNLDLFSVANERDTELQQRIGLKDRFVFIYVGSFGTWYLLNEMLDFFKEAKRAIPSAFLLILTQSKVGGLEESLRERDIHPSDVALTSCPPEEVPRYLSLADAGLFFIKPCFSKLSASPTKFGEYLASGLPVVINAGIGDTDQIVRRYKLGVVLEAFEEVAYRRGVQDLLDLLQEDLQIRDRCRKVAETQLSLKDGVQKYRNIYGEVSKKKT